VDSFRGIGMGTAVPHFAVSQPCHIPVLGLERLTANEFTREFFQVYKFHSCGSGRNETLRFTMLAPSCLMDARDQCAVRQTNVVIGTGNFEAPQGVPPIRLVSSIPETRQSAAYSSLRRKTRDKQAGDSGFTPPEESALLSQAVPLLFELRTVPGYLRCPDPPFKKRGER